MIQLPGVVPLQGVTQIRYCTDGVLLQEMMEDPLLSKYRCGHAMTASEVCVYTRPCNPSDPPGLHKLQQG